MASVLAACSNGDSNPTGDGASPEGGGQSTAPAEAGSGLDASGSGLDSSGGGSQGPVDATGGGLDAMGDVADASGDVGSDAGTPACGGLVCEDFESGQIDATKWTSQTSGGSTLSVQSQQVAHGKYALQVHAVSSPSDDWALLVVKNVPAALVGATTFGRAYFYATAQVSSDLHITFVQAGSNGTGPTTGPAPFPKLRYEEVAISDGRWQLGMDLTDPDPGVEEVSYSNNVTTGKWVCLEWEFQDQPDQITLWADGTQAGTFNNTNVGYASPGPIPAPGSPLWNGMSSGIIGRFDTFAFGMHDWHPQAGFDIYYDDVVLGASRVGCLQ